MAELPATENTKNLPATKKFSLVQRKQLQDGLKRLVLGIKHRWRTSALYWKVDPMWRDISFRIYSSLYPVRHGLHDAASATANIASIVTYVVRQASAPVGILLLLLALDHSVITWLLHLHAALPSPAAGAIISSITKFAVELLAFLSNLKLATGGNYVYIPSTAAQISATLLAVYIAALGIGVSTGSVDASARLREVMLRDPVNNAFVKVNVFLFCLSIFMLLGLFLTGFTPGLGMTIAVVFLLIVSVASIDRIATRGFWLFDPEGLAGTINSDIIHWVNLATLRGWFYYNPSFQSHYQKQAEQKLEAHKDLVSTCTTRKGPENSVAVCEQLISLYTAYDFSKGRIPSDSLWFRAVRRHDSWMTADHTRTDLAIKTRTPLKPTESRDLMWFEDEILTMVKKLMQCQTAEQTRAIQRLLLKSNGFLRALSYKLQIKESVLLQRTLHGEILEFVRRAYNNELEMASGSPAELSLMLGTIEVSSVNLGEIIHASTTRINALKDELRISELVRKIDWTREEAPFSLEIPRAVADDIDRLRKQLLCEVDSEGTIVTPEWFRAQVIAASLLTFLSETVDTLTTALTDTYIVPIRKFITDKRGFAACQLIERGLESCSKLALLVQSCEALSVSLVGELRNNDVRYVRLDGSSANQKIKEIHNKLVECFGVAAIDLQDVPHSSAHWPDYVGHAYWLLCELCHESIVTGDAEEVGRIFSQLLMAVTFAQEWLKHQISGLPADEASLIAFDCLIDLLQLSGYALLYSELEKPGCWDAVKKCWEDYFAIHKDLATFFEGLSRAVQSAQQPRNMTGRQRQQSQWAIRFRNKLRTLGLVESSLYFGSNSPLVHKSESPIIRALIKSHSISDYPEEVFLVTYIFEKPDAATIKSKYQSDFADDYWEEEESVSHGEINNPPQSSEQADSESNSTVDTLEDEGSKDVSSERADISPSADKADIAPNAKTKDSADVLNERGEQQEKL